MKKYIAVIIVTLALLLFYLFLVSGSKKDEVLPIGESLSSEQSSGIVIDVATATAEEIVSVLYQELPNDDGSGSLGTGGMQ